MREQVLRAALNHYGIKHQLIKTLEEMDELGQAIAKLWCEEGDVGNVAEEIADVRIMLDQIEMALQLEDEVRRQDGMKVLRLMRRMEK